MVHSRTFSNRSKLSITPLPLSRAANLLVLLIKNPGADAAGWRQVHVQAGSVPHHDNPPGCVPVCEFGRQRAWTNASGRQHPARWLAQIGRASCRDRVVISVLTAGMLEDDGLKFST